jgi:hypothetical protein
MYICTGVLDCSLLPFFADNLPNYNKTINIPKRKNATNKSVMDRNICLMREKL